MYNYIAFNGTSVFRGNATNIGYAYSGVPSPMPNLSPASYANFQFGGNNLSYPRINYQVGSFGADSYQMRFKKGGFDSGTISLTNTGQLKGLLGNIGTQLKISGVLELFGPAVEEAAAKKDKKSVEEIINLILNYGAKAVEIGISLGIIKKKNQGVDDGWGNIDGLEAGGYDPMQLPQQRQLPTEGGSGTILGFKIENVLIGTGVAAIAIAFFKK